MSETKLRTIVLFEHYFSDFFIRQRQKVRDKIIWVFRIIEAQRQIPSEYFKYLEGTDGLYEIRVQQGGDIFRIFCFFDADKIVVLANGFQKKTQRIPATEIECAIRIKKEYEQKKEHKNAG